MYRKSLFFLSFITLTIIAVWSLASSSNTTASAAATPTECKVKLTVNDPTLKGTPANPQGARVTWTVDQVPPCYRLSGIRATFNFTLADGSVHQKEVNVAPNATQAQVELNLTAPLAKRDRPTVITSTVVATAVPIDNQIRGTGNATTEIRN
jgi:hypothetical protein